MTEEIRAYNNKLEAADKLICQKLFFLINEQLVNCENKIWHGHPVWFINGNPIVGYSKLKNCVRLLFWSGQSFTQPGLTKEGSFKAAEMRFTTHHEIDDNLLKRYLEESVTIQWDYKNIVKRKGQLERLL